MIKTIAISNFAIIKDTKFQLHEGLNIITGETGAGKSVVATAISLALGARADSAYVRHGADKAIVEISGNLKGEEYSISREITFNGKNACKLNGETVTLAALSMFCRNLAHIHGQFDNQALLNPETHIDLVDRFAMAEIYPALDRYRHAYDSFVHSKAAYDKLLAAEADGRKKEDFYRFSIDEIEKAGLRVGEDDELEERLSILQNSEKISAGILEACEVLSEAEFSAENLIGRGLANLRAIDEYSNEIAGFAERLQSISYDLDDLTSDILKVKDSLSFSPNELDETIERLSLIDALKKKYGHTVEEILSYCEEISVSLDNIENFDSRKNEAKEKLDEASAILDMSGKELTKLRKAAAAKLSEAISAELASLNFADGIIEIRFKEAERPLTNGKDIVEIYITTNKGEPLKPLVKTASGGEVSRIMLAIKSITSSFEQIPTLIFDEIDTGISGITASVVGNKLKSLGREKQVISITHLPQIAAKGDYNFRIYKESDDTSTYTFVEELDYEAKVSEIARLLAGTKITEATIDNAKDLIED
ncbi:MAG: DNA repair protein RecN [Peptostreptococcaceae bacterium]|nr:DNA repair protein RecN [Peptostreptococcaceae bacterium]MDY5738882.1 DNA repair protein RecN [Anaerovoracaceae bacterium]